MNEEFEPTPEALVRCLEVLAEEAACLSLSRTFAALQDAIATCVEESEATPSALRAFIPAPVIH
ncbi:MAG TPA: hypothetical protein VE650_14730 [Acetobacteraceae bacterium]|nr:hypothetical protein [Acetobacteraceae bacterium]